MLQVDIRVPVCSREEGSFRAGNGVRTRLSQEEEILRRPPDPEEKEKRMRKNRKREEKIATIDKDVRDVKMHRRKFF